MRILAQSLVPMNPVPYMHLGYLSAYSEEMTNRPPGFSIMLAGSLIFVIAGAILQARDVKASRQLKHKGIFLLSIGVVLTAILLIVKVPSHYAHPRKTTENHLSAVSYHLEDAILTGRPVPRDIALLPPLNAQVRKVEDGWHRPLRLRHRKQNGDDKYVIISAGPDGQFGTQDDMHSRAVIMTEIRETQHHARWLAILIQDRLDSDQAVPKDTRLLLQEKPHKSYKQHSVKPGTLGPNVLLDGWSRPFTLTKEIREDQNIFTIASAGQDGKHGTGDDYVVTVNAKQIIMPK